MMMGRFRTAVFVLMAVVAVSATGCGCGTHVPPGTVGQVKTVNGWTGDLLAPGKHTCFGRDKMYLVDTTYHTYPERMEILVGGKVNLTLSVSVTCSLNPDVNIRRKVFDEITAGSTDHASVSGLITNRSIYNTFLQLKVHSIPREIIGSKPDVETVVANKVEIAKQVRKRIIDESAATPLLVKAVEITNYDWPPSITEAQNRLAEMKLEAAKREAQVAADLKEAEGRLKVEEANKLIEIKKAEAVAESIRVIKEELSNSPEYLRWHEIRMLSDAANGPNNAFILVPYGQDTGTMAANAQLKQMLEK
jgi:hypothetical protein